MSSDPAEAQWTLPSVDRSAAVSRQLVSQQLSALPTEEREVVLLLTAELVTNAVRHGQAPVTVHLSQGRHGVQVEIGDAGLGEPALRPLDTEALGGRGLHLVDSLASTWGVDRHAAGKVVWFRFRTA